MIQDSRTFATIHGSRGDATSAGHAVGLACESSLRKPRPEPAAKRS
jgi:hypothetical protein